MIAVLIFALLLLCPGLVEYLIKALFHVFSKPWVLFVVKYAAIITISYIVFYLKGL